MTSPLPQIPPELREKAREFALAITVTPGFLVTSRFVFPGRTYKAVTLPSGELGLASAENGLLSHSPIPPGSDFHEPTPAEIINFLGDKDAILDRLLLTPSEYIDPDTGRPMVNGRPNLHL